MKYFSMFSGIGGFELGIQRSCIKNKEQKFQRIGDKERQHKQQFNRSANRFACIGYSENNKYAIQIYKKHFKGVKNYGNAKEIDWEKVPDFDLLTAGFPCQSFSIAGKRRGFKDTRGTLFFEIARAVKEKLPWFLLLENVKGLLNHSNGKTFRKILKTLDELGYDAEWQVLNSKNFGVPQNRERVFIVGHLRGKSKPEVFPIGGSSQGNLAYSAGVISQREKWLKGEKHLSREFSQGQRVYSERGISQTLAGNAGGQGGKTGLYEIKKVISSRNPKTVYNPKGISPTFREGHGDGVRIMKNMKIRRLTPTECERLQGFPDGWTEKGIDVNGNSVIISDTQRYKVLGNAVTTNVIKEIFCQLKKCL